MSRKSVATSILRGDLKSYLDEVAEEGEGLDITMFGKIQATILPPKNADLIYDLSIDQILEMHEKLGKFLETRERHIEGRRLTKLHDILLTNNPKI